MSRFVPMVIEAHLSTPPIVSGPLMFDALLLAGNGYRMGRASPSGWASSEDVAAVDLPLARLQCGDLWWYACSQVTPRGGEQVMHKHRRPPVDLYTTFTKARGVNHASGPDKALRIPAYYRPGMLDLGWTCIGVKEEVSSLLSYVPSIGKYTTDGWGWVRYWSVTEVSVAQDYGDPAVRHIPAVFHGSIPIDRNQTFRMMPLRPPYYNRHPNDVVSCIQEVG